MNRIVRALESPWAARLLLNTYPPYLMTGIRVLEVSPDWRRVIVRMGLHWYNRNYFGTQFGGSLYAMTDPFYAIMLVRNLGPGHIVWDRAQPPRVARSTTRNGPSRSAKSLASLSRAW